MAAIKFCKDTIIFPNFLGRLTNQEVKHRLNENENPFVEHQLNENQNENKNPFVEYLKHLKHLKHLKYLKHLKHPGFLACFEHGEMDVAV